MKSREIKFRAWHEINKNMHPPSSMFEITTNGQIYREGFNCTDDYILMQYTGLKDKNGKEIYEGDIYRLRYPKRLEQTITIFLDVG